MQRSSDLYREALNTIEHRLLEARAAMDSSISDFQILEPASPPNYPLGTGRRKFALAGGVLGAMLPLLFFGGIELLDRRTKSALDLARLTRGGVTVTLPEAPGEMEQLLSPRLQVLYDRVMNAAGPPPAQRRVVVVVGEPDGIGRRFIARRLALLARAAGLQPCVVAPAEADEVPDVPLINDFLLARDGLEALVPLRSAEGVDELRIRADERLLSTPVGRPRIRAVFEHLGAHATPVFLLALGSDFSPQLLADMVAEADQTLVVCGFRRTPLETLRRMIEAAGPGMSVAPVLVLNRIDKEYYRA